MPSIRIGLTTTAHQVRVSAAGDFHLVEKIPEAPRLTIRGEVLVRVERVGPDSAELYRVQVASLSNARAAEDLCRTLAEKFSLPAITRSNPSTGTVQVRVGEFSSREEAQNFAQGALTEAGYPDALVIRETASGGTGEGRLALRGPENLFQVNTTGFLFLPSSRTGFLRLDGKPYRGILDLTLNRNGRITVVNQLGMEDYLYGVVPAEISPAIYPEPAGLAAQAVAARTYALKNLGRFSAEGFDLTADVRTQVYGGAALEKEATSEAVRGTHGLALYFGGELINAMYSSTCGGRTEDFSNVFDGPPVPYLTSVSCTVETGAGAAGEIALKGKHDLDEVVFADDGSPANRFLALARVLGLVQGGRLSPDHLGGAPSEEEVRAWVGEARELAGKTSQDASAPERGPSRAEFIRYAAESFFGAQEISRRISPADAAYYLGNLKDGDQVPRQASLALAYLMQGGLWRPHPDNTARPGDPIRRSDALALLVRWIESARTDILKTGVFAGTASSSGSGSQEEIRISVKTGNRTHQFPLSPELRLFRRADGSSTAVDILRIIGNEKISYHLSSDGTIDLLEVELNPTGASSDRFSPVATWQTTLSRQALSEKLRGLAANIGEIVDLEPARLGNSGRAVQLRALGTRGTAILNGYRVRVALGLRDTLFTISRAYTPQGRIESFTFNGRGWGHGVGLCQVGAYGMARSGLAFEEILKAYYRGVELRKAY